MESVESPLEVLSRAATMVQHCRTYSNSEQPDDAESVNSSSPCGSNANVSPPNDAATAASGTDTANAKPTSKWRRERRCTTRIPDYKHRENGLIGNKALRSQSFNDKSTSKLPTEQIGRTRSGNISLHHSDSDLSHYDEKSIKSESETTKSNLKVRLSKPPDYVESPLDMSVKLRSSPPSYSQSVNSNILFRPSVITQANGNTSNPVSPTINKMDVGKGEYIPGSMSMCDPVIDEHFRRSLGADYMALFAKSKENASNGVANGKNHKAPTKDRGSSPIMFASDPCSKYLSSNVKPSSEPIESAESENEDESEPEDTKMEIDESAGLTVDDHFEKALGDTWRKLQEKNPHGEIMKNVDKVKSFGSDDKKDLTNSNHDKTHSRRLVI